MAENKKNKFVLWLEHMWWAHKWMILSIAAAILLIVFSTWSVFQRRKPDVNILYVGPVDLSISLQSLLEENLQDMIPDVNEDGKKVLAINSMHAETKYADYIFTDESDYTVSDGEIIMNDPSQDLEYSRIVIDSDLDYDMRERFNMELTLGDSVIYIIEEYYYDLAFAMGVVAPLEDVLEPENMPETSRDGYSVYLKDLDIQHIPGFDVMPEDIIVCIRSYPDNEAGEILYNKSRAEYDANVELFNQLFAYEE